MATCFISSLNRTQLLWYTSRVFFTVDPLKMLFMTPGGHWRPIQGNTVDTVPKFEEYLLTTQGLRVENSTDPDGRPVYAVRTYSGEGYKDNTRAAPIFRAALCQVLNSRRIIYDYEFDNLHSRLQDLNLDMEKL